MQFEYDVEAMFQFIGDRKKNIYEGYRPAHMIQEGYLTTGVHSYYNIEDSAGEIKGTITFISPEDYPNCLWIGKKIEMYEGSKLVGYATILQILNPILQKK
jgi:elongation factor Tu